MCLFNTTSFQAGHKGCGLGNYNYNFIFWPGGPTLRDQVLIHIHLYDWQSLFRHVCVTKYNIIKFVDDTTVMGLMSKTDYRA